MSLARPTVLVIHDDGEALDVVTRLFEAGGFEVVTAASGARAQAYLEGRRGSIDDRGMSPGSSAAEGRRGLIDDRGMSPGGSAAEGRRGSIDLVVAPWDAAHPVGGEVYRWVLHQRYDLRDGFVFLAAEPPPNFDRLVAGRCLGVSLASPAEVVRVANAAIKRRRKLELAGDAVDGRGLSPGGSGAEGRRGLIDLAGGDRPKLLLADDEPVLLMVMADLLGDAGFAVARVESGHAAIRSLQRDEYDVIVTDWNMDDGNGADVYRWIAQSKPWLADRVVFLADEEGEDATVVAPGRPMFRKGQDSRALIAVLREIARQAPRR